MIGRKRPGKKLHGVKLRDGKLPSEKPNVNKMRGNRQQW
jgi:hypothetical protein